MAKKKTRKVKRARVKCPECKCTQMMRVPKTKCIRSCKCKECCKTMKPKKCCIICDYSKATCGCCK